MSSNERKVSSHTLLWKIKQFSVGRFEKDVPLQSPFFKAKLSGSVIWYLLLYPEGTLDNEAEDFVSCFLCRAEDSVDKTVSCKFTLEILDEAKRVIVSQESEYEFEKSMFSGWPNYKKIENFRKNCICFPSDVLIFRCILTRETMGKELISESYAETTLGSNRMNFDWNIKDLKSSDIYWNFKFQCPANSEYEISLHIPEDELYIIIEKFRDNSISMKAVLKVFLINIFKEMGVFRVYEHTFTENKEVWRIVTDIKRSEILKNTRTYLSDDGITFRFQFETGNLLEVHRTYDYRAVSNLVRSKHSLNFPGDFNRTNPLVALQEDLKDLFVSQKRSDITLRAGSVTIPAHKFILCARSPVLFALIRRSSSSYLDLSPEAADYLAIFVEYLYTGVFPDIDHDIAMKLMILAEKYEVPSLKNECLSFLKEKVALPKLAM